MEEQSLKLQESIMVRIVGVLAEYFQHKFVLADEESQMFAEKVEWVEVNLKQKKQKVDQRVTAVAGDLTAYRFDTEAHRGMYGVREDCLGLCCAKSQQQA